MRSKGIVLAVGGLVFLASLGFLLPKGSQASSPLPVAVYNKPTVTVGNTANVSVANTPSVNVANTPSVSVSSMPPVQMNGSVGVTNSLLSPLYVTNALLAPIQVSGNCSYPQGSSTCTLDGVYTVPTGYTAIITYFSGWCGVASGDYFTAAGQLFINGAGPIQTLTAPATGGGTFPYAQSMFGQTTTFYATPGSSITVVFLAFGVQSSGGDSCMFTITGNLAPSSSAVSVARR